MERKEINGKEYLVYTMRDWEEDGTLKVEVGQLIAPYVFFQLLGSVPPKTYGNGLFQVGEPYSHDWNTVQALYRTFEEIDRNYWLYVGLKP